MKFTTLAITLAVTLSSVFVTSCSTPEIVRVPTPLTPISSPYQLQKDWQVSVGGLDYSDGEGLYIAEDEKHVYFSSPGGELTSVFKAKQHRWVDQIAWQVKYDQPILSGPSLTGSRLVIGTAKGRLLLVSKVDGRSLWETQLSSEVMSKAVFHQGSIFVRTVDGKLVSLNEKSGKINWTVESILPKLSLRGISPITAEDGILYVSWESGFVEALDARTGARQWKTKVVEAKGRTDLERMIDIQSDLLLANGRLYVLGYHGKLLALNPSTGNLYWSKDVSGFREFIIHQSRLVLVDEDDILHAYDVMTGTEIWKQSSFRYRGLNDLVSYDKNRLLLSDRQGYIHWINSLDGSTFASVEHGHDGFSTDIVRVYVDGSRLCVQDTDGLVSGYRVTPSDWYEFNHPTDPLKINSEY